TFVRSERHAFEAEVGADAAVLDHLAGTVGRKSRNKGLRQRQLAEERAVEGKATQPGVIIGVTFRRDDERVVGQENDLLRVRLVVIVGLYARCVGVAVEQRGAEEGHVADPTWVYIDARRVEARRAEVAPVVRNQVALDQLATLIEVDQ